MTGPSALITGATGFIGRYLVTHMLEQGWNVAALVRDPSRAIMLPDSPRLRLVGLTPGEDLHVAMRSTRPDVTVHLATHFVARHSGIDQVKHMVDANIAFGMLLADAAADAGVPLVSASSVWQHYAGARYDPVSLYAATKQALDDVLRYYSAVAGLGWTRIVVGDTYGPGDTRGKLLTHLLRAARDERPLEAASGYQLWDAVHVTDVARAFTMAALEQLRDPAPREYQLRPNRSHTIREIVDVAQKAIARPIPVEWGARPDRGREMLHPWVVAAPPPGWHPHTELSDGIREIWRLEFATTSD